MTCSVGPPTALRRKRQPLTVPLGFCVFFSGIFLARLALAADCNGNGVEDAVDIARRDSPDCNENGIPDECELILDFNLSPAESFAVGLLPHVLEAADVDGDGDLDLLATDRADDTLSLLINGGKGGFDPRVVLLVRDEPRGIDSGDVDGDGDLDVVSGNGNEDSVGDLPTNSLLLNQGGGSFAAAISYPANPAQAGALRSVSLVDLDGDGDLDIVNGFSESESGGVITLLMNEGQGTFSAPRVISTADPTFEGLRSAKYVATGRVNEDGLPDIVTLSGQVLLNLGGGRFASPVSFGTIDEPMNVTLADLDLDGDLDVAILRTVVDGFNFMGEVVFFFNDAGVFLEGSPSVLLPAQIQEGLAAGDLDRDGDVDLAVTFHGSFAAVLFNDGEGRFELFQDFFPLDGGVPRWVLAEDFNGDGRPDLALPKSSNEVSLLFNLHGRDENGNGILDECDPRFFRGDPNGDGAGNLTDAVFLLVYLFQGGEPPSCRESGDADDTGEINIADAVYLLQYLFRGGPPPPPPGPPAGICRDESGLLPYLGCASYVHCS